ncbi:hypothetical protein L484_006036 [Morus notabilis]|uniref:Sphingomyelin synthase-like domain-containing protein n=1 Tax=Morus notabilis TaxID=981085 RepID=W9QE94_9ROSA|nr:hypothetical protein L484_006036 [Morus notabilis]
MPDYVAREVPKELGRDKAYMSETLFTIIFCSFVLVSQILRILTFYSTQLPGPNYHCRELVGYVRCIKQCAWVLAVVQSLLIIASRKHYTVDIVVAWYTVNLVAFFVDNKLPELPDRSVGSTTPSVLPLSTTDKDSRNKEEFHRFMNGSSADITV